MSETSIPAQPSFGLRAILPALVPIILGGFMAILDTTIVNLAIPTLGRVFSTEINSPQMFTQRLRSCSRLCHDCHLHWGHRIKAGGNQLRVGDHQGHAGRAGVDGCLKGALGKLRETIEKDEV